MVASLRTLLRGLIDYAGLFPPAKLPLDQAIREFAQYWKELDHWMLGHFVCPASQLRDLEPYLDELFPKRALPFGLSVLGSGGNEMSELLANLRCDQFSIDLFEGGSKKQVVVSNFEVRLPTDYVPAVKAAATDLTHTVKVTKDWRDEKRAPLMIYWEPSFSEDWRRSVSAVIDILSADRIGKRFVKSQKTRPRGIKLRCGGMEAAAVPSSDKVAFVIAACRDAGVALKFTAGLHHPVRHFDSGLQTRVHGFVNVFGAGVLAFARQLNEQQIRQVIEEEDPSSFVFSDEGVQWRDLQASTEEIAEARRQAVISFGSCSFDEPRDDLRKLGWLD
ncbi:MAG TPA: hypothetical protein VGG61_10415 [Gemmataceae bacterium]